MSMIKNRLPISADLWRNADRPKQCIPVDDALEVGAYHSTTFLAVEELEYPPLWFIPL